MGVKEIAGLTASVIGLASYVPYFRDIFLNKTKPHLFSWFVWGIISGTAFFLQREAGSGPGTWAIGLSSVACFSITILAFFRRGFKAALFDWLALLGALSGIILWQLIDNQLLAIILISLADFLAFTPSFKKAYYKPEEETLSTWIVSALKFALILLATETYSYLTIIYPLSLVLSNGSFSVMLFIRRRKIKI